MGCELDERTIPAEAGIVEASVSWTKGCYTGQELVARIDSRGNNVPRRLRLLTIEGTAAPTVGAMLCNGRGRRGGQDHQRRRRLLGPVVPWRSAMSPDPWYRPASLVARWVGGEATVRAEALPE